MAESTRFLVAVHVLTLLAYEDGKALTSDHIAGSVNTNPVVIRRILGLLARAGLVSSAEGAGGGTTLARPAERIMLSDVYRAVEGELAFFAAPRSDPNPLCPVGRCVQEQLKARTRRIETAVERELKKTTLGDVLADVRAAARR